MTLRSFVRRALRVALLILAACGDDPTGPALPELEAVVAGGDAQFGTAGQELPLRLHVVVRSAASAAPHKDVTVRWSVEQGDAAFLGSPATVTDSTGSAFARIRLGSAVGAVTVRAQVVEQQAASATFRLTTIERPTLTAVSPASAAAGSTVTLTGTGFLANAADNVVLFSGVRGRVTSATATELRVEVPACLPTRSVGVAVQLGAVSSGVRTLAVQASAEPIRLDVGEVIDVADDAGLTCLRLSGAGSASYLAVVYSASTIGAARHPFVLTGLSGSAATAAATAAVGSRPSASAGSGPWAGPGAQSAWDERLRALEERAVRERRASPAREPLPLRAPAAVPSIGERRTFHVYNGTGFDQVGAVVRFVSSAAALFVDESVPSGALTDADLRSLAQGFDSFIQPTVARHFGQPSDLDRNERVAILFTPVVNRLTPRGSNGFVGGFFFGIDLLPERNNSNAAEVFYTLVPDPSGQYSDPRPKSDLLKVIPAILAHEYEHMVHFNERVLKLGAVTEALWLSEALALTAEEMVARAYDEAKDRTSAENFRVGNRSRARRYLSDPSSVSLIVGTGAGTLEERGAGFLHLLYLSGHHGDGILGSLTRSKRTGVDNVLAVSGGSWADQLADWWAASYLDRDPGELGYPGVDLRAFLGAPYPLAPERVGTVDFTRGGSLWSSGPGYYIVEPSPLGSVTLRLGGEAGGASAPSAALRMRVVRFD